MEQKAMTSHELKKINRSKIYQHIYSSHGASRPDLASALQMSLPTITQNLTELAEKNLIEKSGFQKSTGGRKAQILTCNTTARIAIGTQILKDFVQVCAIDLYGIVIKELRINLPFSNETAYFQTVGTALNAFATSITQDSSQILGIGIAIQGLVSADGTSITYGKILNCTGLELRQFSKYLNYPCILIHDSEAAAQAELWHQKEITHAVYLSLNRNLGGAIILNGTIYQGNTLMSGTFEHICFIPDGKPCYCGKKGCLEAYCSADSLKEAAGTSLDTFFQNLRMGGDWEKELWHTYLNHLALAISNIRHVIDCDFIIGGLLRPYFAEEDYTLLSESVQKFCSLSAEKVRLLPGLLDQKIASIGAGLHYITEFLNTI